MLRGILKFLGILSSSPVITQPNKDRIPTEIRNAVWNKYHGDRLRGVCYACGCSIERYNAGWHCSHVLAREKGGSIDVDNLRTCCPHCNLSMCDQNLYAYIRNKRLLGPGSHNVPYYFSLHPDQINDTRTNNWRKNKH